MNRIKRRLAALIIAIVMIFPTGIFDKAATAHAEDVAITIALSATNVRIGQSVTATVTVSGSSVSAYTLIVSYSSGILQYSSASGVVGGGGGTLTVSGLGAGSTSITFSAIDNGTAYVATSGTEFYDINGSTLSVAHAGVNVVVATDQTEATTQQSTEQSTEKTTEKDQATTEEKTEEQTEDKRSQDCTLSSLSISPGSLSPAFSKDVTNYKVQLDEKETKLYVSAKTSDSKATTQVSGADNLTKGYNKVTVTVTAENGSVKVYTLGVTVGEEPEEVIIEIGDKRYEFATANFPAAPDNFTPATLTVREQEVEGYESPNKQLKIVCLKDEDSNKAWFIYNEKNDSFVRYNELSAEYARYVILSKPDDVELPKGYQPAGLTIDETVYDGYTDGSDSGIFLIYAMNVDGDTGFYFYDSAEKSFMRFAAAEKLITEEEVVEEPATEVVTTEAPTESTEEVTEAPKVEPKEEKGLSRSILKFIIATLAILFVIMCIAVIVLVIKNGSLQNRIDDYEDHDDYFPNPNEITEESQDAQESEEAVETEQESATKNKSYGVNEDTGEILLEVADDFNNSVNVPPVEETTQDKLKDAINERPYGIDSAFDVVLQNEDSEADDTADDTQKSEETQEAEEAQDTDAEQNADEEEQNADFAQVAEDAAESSNDIADIADSSVIAEELDAPLKEETIDPMQREIESVQKQISEVQQQIENFRNANNRSDSDQTKRSKVLIPSSDDED